MQFIEGINRFQSTLFPETLDQLGEEDNKVSIIDLFIESINFSDFKLVIKTATEGCTAYHLKYLLNLYMYGYLNSIRSSRVRKRNAN